MAFVSRAGHHRADKATRTFGPRASGGRPVQRAPASEQDAGFLEASAGRGACLSRFPTQAGPQLSPVTRGLARRLPLSPTGNSRQRQQEW